MQEWCKYSTLTDRYLTWYLSLHFPWVSFPCERVLVWCFGVFLFFMSFVRFIWHYVRIKAVQWNIG